MKLGKLNIGLAAKPPMGWNSFDCFNASVIEEEIKQHADVLAAELLPYGWEYIVVDFCWSHPNPPLLSSPSQSVDAAGNYTPRLEMDEYSRLLPAPNRFPSSANGKGFKPLADYVHGKDLKFGIHIMRGIPRQAVVENTRILSNKVHAKEIADTASVCEWLNQMYGVDMEKPGAQAYYDSLLRLYASWDVDFIKADDTSFPYHEAEIEALQRAIQGCGRPMVLSLSPGPAPLEKAGHVSRHANMWRVSGDFWDAWWRLKEQFNLCAGWASVSGPGRWADADMLPLGLIELRGPNSEKPHPTHFTCEEQFAFMTLCVISHSPLMFGGHLPSLDDFTRSLLTNPEVLAVNQHGQNTRVLFSDEQKAGWAADVPGQAGIYVALFNLGEAECQVTVDLPGLGLPGPCRVRDLWQRTDLPDLAGTSFATRLPAHGAGLYQIRRST